jgi:hypothetical protein
MRFSRGALTAGAAITALTLGLAATCDPAYSSTRENMRAG